MRSPKIVVGVVLFGTKYLSFSLPSLLAQDYRNLEFLFRDQSPDGAAADFIQRELPEIAHDPRVKISRGENLFHSGGHNMLIREAVQSGAQFYLCASNDMFYEPNLVSELVHGLHTLTEKQIGAVTGKSLRWDFFKALQGDIVRSKTKLLDSLGIGLTRAHRFFDLGQGVLDQGQIQTAQKIFGVSGALALYSIPALLDVAYARSDGTKEFFDELMHYKNDVDLAYRFRLAGYQSYCLPSAVAYHDRQVANRGFFANRSVQSRFVRESSFLGQRIVLYKNLSPRLSLFTRCATHCRLLAIKIFVLIFEPKLWSQFSKFRQILPELRQKKFAQKIRITPSELEILMNNDDEERRRNLKFKIDLLRKYTQFVQGG